MNNTIKKSFHKGKKSGQIDIKFLQNNLNLEEKDLINEIKRFSATSISDFITIVPDFDQGQAYVSDLVELQERCKRLLEDKRSLEKTIIIEPSKLPEVVEAAERVLIASSEHNVYQRTGKLVRVTQIHNLPVSKNNFIKRSQDSIVIKEIDQAFLTILLTKIGIFYGQGLKKVDCPERISRYLLSKQEWNIPVLTGIINCPTLRPDGSILDRVGYDKESGMLFISTNTEFAKIPENPTYEDAREALKKLQKLLEGFPFDGEVSQSVAIAAILTALVRKSIPTAPLFGFTAPKMATGKSLLADVVALIATGKTNVVITQSDTEAEEKKRLMAILMEGDPIVCYDNIEKPLGSSALCSILTEREYKDRLLGGNEMRCVLTNATFLATGNNLAFSGDTSTRALLCKLDPKVEHPEERTFDIDLRKYIPENRSEIVSAALTILRAYHLAGRPKMDIKPFGRFEDWSNWVRSAIIWVGLADPCESRKEIENEDPVRILLSNLLYSWHEVFGSTGVKIKDVISTIKLNINNPNDDAPPNEHLEMLNDALIDLVGENKGEINVKALAGSLRKYKGRIEGGYKLEQKGSSQRTTLWCVTKITQ